MGLITTANQANIALLADLTRAMNDRREVWGVPYPWRSLNKLTGGMHNEQMIILGGRPGDGKTSVMCQMVLTAADYIKREKLAGVVRVVTNEMSPKLLQTRMAAMLSGVPHFQILAGRLELEEYGLVEDALAVLETLNIEYVEPASIAEAKDFLLQPENPTLFWAMDYIQIHPFKAGNYTAYDRVTNISRSYQWFSRHISPGVALSQLSRPDKSRPSERPTLSSFRDSGAIEQDAAVVLALHRTVALMDEEEILDAQSTEYIPVKLLVLKNRAGPSPRTIGCTFATDRFLLLENTQMVAAS